MHFDLIQSIHDGDYRYFIPPSKVEMRLFRPILDRAGGPKFVPLDFLLYI